MNRERIGVTLIEVLVALFIFSLISLSVYGVMSEARKKTALAEARAQAQREAGKVVSIMQSDLSQAKLGSFKRNGDNSVSVKVNLPGKFQEDTELSYEFSKPVLKRRLGNQVWRVTDCLEAWNVQTVENATGQLVLDVKTEVAFDGLTEAETQAHDQRQMVVMREDMASSRDPHWREGKHVGTFFSTEGSLVAGLQQDANQVVQDFSDMVEDLKNQAKAALAGNLQKAKEGLLQGLTNIKNQLGEIDSQVLGLDNEAIFNFGGLGSRIWGSITGAKNDMKRKAGRMREALSAMKTQQQLNWQTIVGIAGDKKGRMRETMRKMFEGKEELFKAGRQVLKAAEDLKISFTAADGVDPSIFAQ